MKRNRNTSQKKTTTKLSQSLINYPSKINKQHLRLVQMPKLTIFSVLKTQMKWTPKIIINIKRLQWQTRWTERKRRENKCSRLVKKSRLYRMKEINLARAQVKWVMKMKFQIHQFSKMRRRSRQKKTKIVRSQLLI